MSTSPPDQVPDAASLPVTPRGPAHDDAVALVLEHCARSAVGRETAPAVVASVVGVEHVAAIAGTTDADALRRVVTEALDARGGHELVTTVQELVGRVRLALARGGTGWSADAKVLNPETGAHPVSTDLAMLRAAVRAARTSYGLPYYGDRYGMRGALYSVSDSSWLVQLVRAPEAVALEQVRWLSGMLVAKGMPTWLMELHLATLVSELHDADLDPGALPRAADHLAERRRRHVDDALLEQAEHWVLRNVSRPPTSPSGRLVAAAVADVRAGVFRDGEPVLGWLTDPARTTPQDAAALRAVHAQVDAVSARRSGGVA